MYNLTDFSLDELRMLSSMVSDKLEAAKEENQIIKRVVGEGEVRDDLLKINNKVLTIVRELNVRILTSIDIVKNRESVQSN